MLLRLRLRMRSGSRPHVKARLIGACAFTMNRMNGLPSYEMYAPDIADDLCQRGIDAVAVCGHDTLGGMSDERLLEWATSHGRSLVTENVRDFERLRVAWVDQERAVAGLIYLSARRFPRASDARKQIFDALASLADQNQALTAGGVVWLS